LELRKAASGYIFTVSRILGHADIQTTMIYSHLLTEHRARVMNMLDFGSPDLRVVGGKQIDGRRGKIRSKRENAAQLVVRK